MNDELTSKEKEQIVFGIHDDEAITTFKNWTEDSAQSIASELGIELTEEHWKVIRFLRVHFENSGPTRHAREYAEVLKERFIDEGGSRYLYRLFPQGPVSNGCRLAGIPIPADAADSSFGTRL